MNLHTHQFLIYFCHQLEAKLIRDDTTVRPNEATEADLRVVHSKSYIKELKVRSLMSVGGVFCRLLYSTHIETLLITTLISVSSNE